MSQKHWIILAVLTVFLPILISLGLWQINRAEQKTALLHQYDVLQKATPVHLTNPKTRVLLDYQPIKVTGNIHPDKHFLIDNQTYKGQAGYHLLSTVIVDGSDRRLLINRGWIAQGVDRNRLPKLPHLPKTKTFSGMIKYPSKPFTLSDDLVESRPWPMRLQWADIDAIQSLTDERYYPFILLLAPNTLEYGLVKDWQVTIMGPERHYGYAFQWFMLAATLIVLCIIFLRHR